MKFLMIKKILYLSITMHLSSMLLADERLYLKQAKILESKTIQGKSIKFISEDVVFTKGDLTLNCQEGRQHESKGLAILYNDVSAFQDQRTLTCDTIKFFSREDRLLSIGDSHVWDDDYDLKADTITVFTNIDSGVAKGNVTLIQKGQIIKANRIEYKKDKEKQ